MGARDPRRRHQVGIAQAAAVVAAGTVFVGFPAGILPDLHVQLFWRLGEVAQERRAEPALHAQLLGVIPVAAALRQSRRYWCPGNGVAEKTSVKPSSASGRSATTRSIMVSAPDTNGS